MPAEIPQDCFSFMYLSLSTLISSLCTKIDREARYFHILGKQLPVTY